jgi:hypothetical protein
MRQLIISIFVVLSLISAPAFAIRNVEPGANTFEGKLVNFELGPMLVLDAGSMSELALPVVGETAEIDARLKKLTVEQREFGDMYDDRPTVKCSGAVEIVNKRYKFVVSKLEEPGGESAAQVAALEQIAAGVAALAEGGHRAQAQAIARAAIPLAQELAKTADRARTALRQLQGVAQ